MTALLPTAAASSASGERDRDLPLLSTPFVAREGGGKGDCERDLGGRSHVDYHGFVDQNGAWGDVTLIVDALKNKHCIDQPLTRKSYNIIVSFPRMI